MIVFGSWESDAVLDVCKVPGRGSNGLVVLLKVGRENASIEPESDGFSVVFKEFVKLVDDDFGVGINLLGIFYSDQVLVLFR